MEVLMQFLEKNNFDFVRDFDLSQISAIKLGSIAKIVIFPKSTIEFEKLLKFLYTKKIYFHVVGNASNLLFSNNLEFPVIVTNKISDEVKIEGNFVTAPSGMLISKFCDILRKNHFSGMEALCGIPATIGGAIKNNAGAYGSSISSKLVSISAFWNGATLTIPAQNIKFGNHFSNLNGIIVLSATFWFENKNEYAIMNSYNEFTYKRNISQPSGLSLGSVFQKINGKSAGFYIERAGLKGLRVGGIVVSSKHSNFFVNDRCGSVTDFLRLIVLVQTAVEKQFGLTLIPEIEKVGESDETFGRFSYPFKK